MTTAVASSGSAKQWLSTDRPINSRADDLLGRAAFAEALAHAVKAWSGHDSLVIGLDGPWGSGKSSLKQMALEVLREGDKPAVDIVDFNPWSYANRDQLTTAFFDELGIALRRGLIASRRDAVRAGKTWRRYGEKLQGISTLTGLGALPPAVRDTLVLTVLGLTTGALLTPYTIVSVILLALICVSALTGWLAKACLAIATIRDPGAGDTRPLSEVKAEIAKDARGLDRPMLVVIDDIDRLTPEETAELFQLVKANADFPNIVYMLLYDQTVVAKSLESLLHVDGVSYVQKIVQVAFTVPELDQQRLRRLFLEGLSEIIASNSKLSRGFDRTRWQDVYFGCLQGFLRTPREVNRLIGTLAFHLTFLSRGRVCDVNVIDFTAIEVLRMTESAVFKGIARSKSLLIPTDLWSSPADKEKRKESLRNLIDLASPQNRIAVERTLRRLFPSAEATLGTLHDTAAAKWERELRICATNHFDRYFSLTLAERELSPAQIDEVFSATQDRAELVNKLRSLAEQNLLDDFLERAEAYVEQLPIEHISQVLVGIFDIGDLTSHRSPVMLGTSSAMHAVRVSYQYLRRIPDFDARFAMLSAAIEATTGVQTPIELVGILIQGAAKPEESEVFLPSDKLDALKQSCLQRIRNAAQNHALERVSEPIFVLHYWSAWAGPAEPRAFCKDLLARPNGAIGLARCFLDRSLSSSLHGTVETWYVRLSKVEEFIDFEAVDRALHDIDEGALSDQERVAVRAFKLAVDRRRAGKPDFNGESSPLEDSK